MKIGIYIHATPPSKALFDMLKEYYKDDDLFILNDNALQGGVDDIAVFNFSRARWLDGSVLFLGPRDIQNGHTALNLAKKILLVKKTEMNRLDKEFAQMADEIIIEDKNKIRKAKNAELQRFK